MLGVRLNTFQPVSSLIANDKNTTDRYGPINANQPSKSHNKTERTRPGMLTMVISLSNHLNLLVKLKQL